MLRGTWEQAPFDFDGELLPGRGRAGERRDRAAAGHLLRRLVGPGRPGGGQARRRLPDLGRAARSRWPRSSTGCAALAAEQGRTLRFGLRIHTLSRDTSEEAWRHAQWLLDGLDPERPSPQAQEALRQSESTGQARMLALRGGRTSYTVARELEVSPDLWSGVGLVRGGAGTALVGSHDEVADRLAEYHALGHRRVHPVRLPARRGGLLVRRGRDAASCGARGLLGGGADADADGVAASA